MSRADPAEVSKRRRGLHARFTRFSVRFTRHLLGGEASLEVRKVRGLIEQPRYERGIELLEAGVAMLAKMTSR